VRERVLLVTALVLVAVGGIAAVAKPDPKVTPAACTRRVARALDAPIIGSPTIERAGDGWRATVASGHSVLRVVGEERRVTSVQLLAGPDADILERPARLRALAVRC
jgi:hypothetical protein